jgi:hypothetical protein
VRCEVRRLGNRRVARQIGRRAYYDPADVGSDARRNQRRVRQANIAGGVGVDDYIRAVGDEALVESGGELRDPRGASGG